MSIYKNKENFIKKRKYLSILIFCFLILTLNFQMIPRIIRNDLSNNLRTSANYDPAGIIAMWSGPLNTIPAGWKLSDGTSGTINTTNRFVYSTNNLESPGATGGSSSHNHSYSEVPDHDHGQTGLTSTPHDHTYWRPTSTRSKAQPWPSIPYNALRSSTTSTGFDTASHSHSTQYTGGTGLYMSEQQNGIPPYYEIAFIEKEDDASTIPIGVIVMWAGSIDSIPADWELCNGSNGTPDLRDNFIRGAPPGEDPGTLGGNVAHNHTYTEITNHTHSIASSGDSHDHGGVQGAASMVGALIGQTAVYRSTSGGFTDYSDVPHTHTVFQVGQVDCTTNNVDNLPSYFKVAFIMNTVVTTTAVPLGVISMWGDSIANIPAGWNQCNGTNNTPNLLNRFPRGVADGEQPGIVGGSATHRHNYTEIPLHTHTLNSDNMTHRHSLTSYGSLQATAGVLKSCYWSGGATFTSSINSPEHSHVVLPYGSPTPYTEYESSLPPYVKLIYMQKIGAISNPSPEDGATDISYNPILSVAVNDLEGDDLNISFYNTSDDSLIGLDSIFGGFGTASVTWSGLSNGTVYSWYAKADDGTSITQSATWSFTTNFAPSAPTNPTPNDGATDISYSPTLSVGVSDDDGEELTVSFYNASDDSLIDADVVLGGTGTASVTWSGLSSGTVYSWYAISDDGLSINQSATWFFTTNFPSNVPTNPTPNDGATGISHSPTLSVDVSDDDGDDLAVSFYDASDDSLIDADVVLGGTGTASVTWSGLSSGMSYSWYAISNDGLSINQSATWSFTANYVPNVPTYPTPNDGATDLDYSPTLSVDVSDDDGDTLTVTFYNASDDSLIGSDAILGGTGTASVTWSGLSSGMSYSWYAISDDGLNINQSATWSFTTNYVPNVPTNPTPNDGATHLDYSPTLSVDVSDDDGDTLTVSFYDTSDDSLIGSDAILGGTGTASVTWSGLSSGMSYSWYAISNDGLSINQSAAWSFTTNYASNVPTNPTPNDGTTDLDYSPTLSVDVSDDEGDDLTVSFYDASDDSLIDADVVLGGTGTASVTWSGLSSGMSYSWYAISDDGLSIIQSATWSFTTNYVPNAPTNPVPSDNAYNVEDNPTLSVDVSDDDGDTLTVTFYNATDYSVIDSVTITGGSGIASVIWSGVTSEMICRWYVIADDGMNTTQSPTWTFITYDEAIIPPAVPLPGLIPFGLIVIGTTGILSVKTYLRRKRLK